MSRVTVLSSESTNNQKLMLEYEKFQELQVKSQRMQEDYEHQLSEMEEKRKQAVDDITEFYEAELQTIKAKLEQVSGRLFFILKCVLGL